MNTCRLCSSTLSEHWSVSDAKARATLSISFCTRCGLVQQTQLPSDEELKIYYSHHYREDYKSTHTPKAKYVRRAGQSALNRLHWMRKSGIQSSGQKLLDIGAGGGEFCYMAKQAGFAAQGIEPHQGYSEFARQEYGIEVRTCGIAELPNAEFDVVTLFHVYEHLAQPQAVMQKVWEVLRPEGRLVMEVPNIHQSDASPHNIYFKAHLFYYSRFSLLAAASRWFEVEHTLDEGNLFMCFKRRSSPLADPIYPTADEIELTRKRLDSKGWGEYLTEGGGLKKPMGRFMRSLEESKLKGLKAREVLDGLLQAPMPKPNWAMIAGLVVVGLGLGLLVD